MKATADPYTRTSFGRLLQKTRIEKGIRLADVAGKTRLRAQILSAIEKEEHEILPAESFVKGMLKAFAKAVEADSAEVLRLYEQDRKAYNELDRLQLGLNKSIRGGWLKLVCILGLLVALATFSIFLMTSFTGGINTASVSDEQGNALSKQPAGKSSRKLSSNNQTGASLSDDPIKPAITEKKPGLSAMPIGKPDLKMGATDKQINDTGTTIRMDGYLLSIHAIKNTWIKVIADDQEAAKYQLKTGDRLDLTAQLQFNMLIGSADGVRLMLNGKRVPVTGKSGQIVNIVIP